MVQWILIAIFLTGDIRGGVATVQVPGFKTSQECGHAGTKLVSEMTLNQSDRYTIVRWSCISQEK